MHFNRAVKSDVSLLLDEHHYIGDRCADPTYVFVWRVDGGLFGDDGRPVAAALFAPSAARAWRNTYELVRLVREPLVQEPLSKFLGLCTAYIKRDSSVEQLVAYADPSAGHHGGIYQACNWIYVGMSSPKLRMVCGTTGRTFSQRSFDQSRFRYDKSGRFMKIKTGAKHTYILPLTKRSRRMLKSRTLPYPKPQSSTSGSD